MNFTPDLSKTRVLRCVKEKHPETEHVLELAQFSPPLGRKLVNKCSGAFGRQPGVANERSTIRILENCPNPAMNLNELETVIFELPAIGWIGVVQEFFGEEFLGGQRWG